MLTDRDLQELLEYHKEELQQEHLQQQQQVFRRNRSDIFSDKVSWEQVENWIPVPTEVIASRESTVKVPSHFPAS